MSSGEAKFSPTLRLGKVLAAATAEEIHAAAAAALKSLPAGKSTVFFSESDDSSGAGADDKGSDDSPDTPESSSKSVAAAIPESPPASPASNKGNPLAAILGYSDDEVSGPGDDSPRLDPTRSPQLPFAQQNEEEHPQQPETQHEDAQQEAVQQQSTPQQQSAAPLQDVQQQDPSQLMGDQQGHSKPDDAGTPPGDGLDAELASFMQELESSGLLAGTDAEAATAANAASVEPVVGAAAGDSRIVAADVDMDAATGAAPSGVADTAAVETTSASEPDEAVAEDEPAEQRTLGQLSEAPEWCKVLDTGSGKAYYWNVNSNEVLWEPPEGINGDNLTPLNDAAAETAVTTAEGEERPEVDTEVADADAVSGALEAAEPTDAAVVPKQQPDAVVLKQESDADMPDAAEAAAAPMESAASPGDSTAGAAAAAAHNLEPASVEATDASPSAQQQQPQPQQLPAPQQDVQAVFLTLLQELQAPPAAKCLLHELPEAVKLTLQLQLLHQQWQSFAARQSAAAVGDAEQQPVFDWVQYELYIMQQLQQAVQRLQPAVKELQQHSKQQQPVAQEVAQAAADKIAVDGELQQQQAQPPAAGSPQPPPAADSSEEGEVPESSDDMDIDIDTDAAEPQQQQQPRPVSSSKPAQQPAAASRYSRHRSGARARRAAYTAVGTYTSTAYMPAWAQPTHHYDFHAGYGRYDGPYDRGYDAAYDAFRRYDAAYSQRYDPMYIQQYGYGTGYSNEIAVGYGSDAPAAVAVAGPPPLPDEAPPPLPEEPAPPGDAENPPLPAEMPLSDDATAAAADGTAVAAVDRNVTAATAAAAPAADKPKRKQYVSQPVRNPAAAVAAEGVQPGWAAEELSAAAAPSASLLPLAGSEALNSRNITPPLPGDEVPYAPATAPATGVVEARKRAREKEKGKTVDGPSAKLPKAGKMSALLNKWASVRQQQEEEEAERQRRAELAADPEYQEQKRLEQREKWKQQQLQSGAADDNPNFTPVAGDWRAKLGLGGDADSAAAPAALVTETADDAAAKAARKAARKAAKQAAKQAAQVSATATVERAAGGQHWPTNSKTKPDLEALSVGLPAGWIAMWDKGSGDIYYGNPTTKETSWERP